jgi:hypothetical protein
MMVVVTVYFNCLIGIIAIEVLMIVAWMSTVYVLWISCIVSIDCTIRDGHRFYNSMVSLQMGTGFIIVWFHCNLIVKIG